VQYMDQQVALVHIFRSAIGWQRFRKSTALLKALIPGDLREEQVHFRIEIGNDDGYERRLTERNY
jgi:hypothetical protein